MGGEGAYDDLELTVVDGRIEITRPPLVPVYCFELLGGNDSAASLELFDAPGPWTVGSDASVEKEGIAGNELVGSSPRTITYKLTGTTQEPGRLTGSLGMTFYGSRYDPFSGTVTINCSGTQSFEAVPAG
jgi:hypothetical protein